MAKRVQLVRHDPLNAQQFVGREGEVTVELETYTLRVHNGLTAGGFLLLNKTTADQLYQANNAFLGGINALAAASSGILVKQATSAAVKELVAGTNIAITNGDGTASGNITIATSGLGTAATTNTGSGASNVPLVSDLAAATSPALWPIGMGGFWFRPLADLPSGFQLVANSANRYLIGANGDGTSEQPTSDITGSALHLGGSVSTALTGASVSAGGDHNHTSLTGSTVLTAAQMPSVNISVYRTQSNNKTVTTGQGTGTQANSGEYLSATHNGGGNAGHTHTIGSSGTHTHPLSGTISIYPPHLAAYLVKRVS